jgi:hypothetical protein
MTVSKEAVEAAALELYRDLANMVVRACTDQEAIDRISAAFDALPFLAPQPRQSDEDRAKHLIEHIDMWWNDDDDSATPTERALAAFAAVRAEATLAERERFESIVDAYAKPGRFKVSDSWRDDMAVSQVYETAVIDVSGWLKEQIAARKT